MPRFSTVHTGFSPTVRCLAVALVAALATASAHAEPVDPPGLGDPGTLESIQIETGGLQDGRFMLSGRDSSQQLLVTGHYSSGQVRDLSHRVTYESKPPGFVQVDSTGLVVPLQEGEAAIVARLEGGPEATVQVTVTHVVVDLAVNFPNEVVPIFTKFTCNSGGCHGKSGGQNGFALSLLGFEPQEDFEHLVHEGRGRRLFPAAPDRSLLLLKPAGILPHGGGQRFHPASPAYRIIRRWIEQGMPYSKPEDPQIVRIDVAPRERLMPRNGQQQLAVVAHYSDGSTRDVTRMTQFESNDVEMAELTETGLVTTSGLTGSVAVMTRYQSQVDVFRATIPLGAPVDHLPPVENFIDELVFAKLKLLGLPPSEVCDDATFLRRVTIDLAGRLPRIEEVEQFLADPDPGKRKVAVDRLLGSTDYADYFTNKWTAVLRNKRNEHTKTVSYAFHAWIRDSLHRNRPYDDFVRHILAASGQVGTTPPVAWFQQVKDISSQVEDTAQLFLGMRIQCARCHHHPFEKWSQEDYYGLAAFFAQVGRKPSRQMPNVAHIYHRDGVASAKNPKTGSQVKPTGLGGEPMEISAGTDPRQRLVDWMASAENPYFAHALVNRYWKHFFGRGLVEPEDDIRVTNPATNPQLLNALAGHFVAQRFDMKDLVRTITTSIVYQLSATPNEFNERDKQNFSRYYPQRLKAEVLLDAIDMVTQSPTQFSGVPLEMRAVQLPDNAFNSYFLNVFGRPAGASACECERSSDSSLAQSLHLINSTQIQEKVAGTRAAGLAADERPHEQRIRELYLSAYARDALAEEVAAAKAHINNNEENLKTAYEDIIWALINTKEFLFNH